MIPVAALGKAFHQAKHLDHPTTPAHTGTLYHGSPAKLRPGASLHPSTGAHDFYKKAASNPRSNIPTIALAHAGMQAGPRHRTYATPQRRIAKVFATADYHNGGTVREGTTHVYSIHPTRHQGWKRGAEDGMGFHESFSTHSVRPTHVVDISSPRGHTLHVGHSYANEGRHMQSGFVSKLRHNNVTPHAAINSLRSNPVRVGPKPKIRPPRVKVGGHARINSHALGHMFATHKTQIAMGVIGAGVIGGALYANHRAAQREQARKRVRK